MNDTIPICPVCGGGMLQGYDENPEEGLREIFICVNPSCTAVRLVHTKDEIKHGERRVKQSER